MNEIQALAEKIYVTSLYLKGQKSTYFIWKKNHEKWLSLLGEMYEAVCRMEEFWDNFYSYEYWDLLDEMKKIIMDCDEVLRQRRYGYKVKCIIYMQAFHNLARAFLPPENRMRVSMGEAREYAGFWLRHLER